MIEHKKIVGPFQCNCRVLICPTSAKAVIIDPGDEGEKLSKWVRSLKAEDGRSVELVAALHTHAHLDHIGGTRTVKERFLGVPQIYLHRDDLFIYEKLPEQGRLFGMQYDDPLPVDHFFKHEEELRFGELQLSVMHTPGHSPGSVCLKLHENSSLGVEETLFTGDTLFQGSVGRTDLWGGDSDLMFKMIRERIFALDGDIRIAPGHGSDSRIGIEQTSSPFFR